MSRITKLRLTPSGASQFSTGGIARLTC